MISKKVENEINKQINAELYSSYIYLAMAADFEEKNLSGFATWMKKQSQEEINHAMKFYSYLNERGGRVELSQIDQPPKSWNTPLEAFKTAYEHEKLITSKINALLKIAKENDDPATESMLKWFVDEQVEEEASTEKIVNQLEMAKEAPGALLMLDSKLNQRGKK